MFRSVSANLNVLDLFTGIGGFAAAFQAAGARHLAFCEIDRRCQRLLRRHYPGVEIYEDVETITEEFRSAERVDVLCGGFPCQDVSVAGRRKGLSGKRSGLWFAMLRAVEFFKPGWVVVENVPGLLSGCGCTACQVVGRIVRVHARIRRAKGGSPCAICFAGKRMLASHSGRNFTAVVQGLVELGYGVAWRVFDSQFDGVAQRRQRVFVVASFGSGRAAEVLFESESSAWDPPPSREAGERVVAASTGGAGKSCGPKNGNGAPLHLIAGTLSPGAHPGGFNGRDIESGNLVASFGLIGNGEYSDSPGTLRSTGGDCGGGSEHLIAFGGNNTHGPIEIAAAIRAHGGTGHHDFESETFIAHTLKAEGADASEDGTGRGVPIVPVAFNWRGAGNQSDLGVDENLVSCLHSRQGSAVAFTQNSRSEVREINGDGQITGALANDAGVQQQNYVLAFTERTRTDGRNFEAQEDVAYALTSPGDGGRTHSRQIAGHFGVRRLTPRECDRLQGFPDDYTRWDDKGDEFSDSARYRMLGNAICKPTAEWIAMRIAKIEQLWRKENGR